MKKTTEVEDIFLVLSALSRQTSTARDLQNHLRTASGTVISYQTVRNRLRNARLRSRIPFKAPRLTPQHKEARLLFAQNHVNWQLRQWKSVLFKDESRFRLMGSDGHIRIWRRRGERFDPATIIQHDRFGGGSVMVWAGITIESRTELVIVPQRMNADVYNNDIILQHVVPIAYGMDPNVLLMHDNARCHTAQTTRDVLQECQIRVMDWPAYSPDLNPIEHMSDKLEKLVRKRPAAPQTLGELSNALAEEWERIPQIFVRRLLRSMPRRCNAVIQARGGHTKY
ncbi:Transposable element Tcb2 transposase [Blattella germanica]|nr:Transposable element Tcb2 transposase [Blattella germanica]